MRDVDSDVEPEELIHGMHNSTPPAVFNPLHLKPVWVEPGTTTNMVSFAILLPSGIGPGDFSLRVLQGGRELQLEVKWPHPLIDLPLLHKKWIMSSKEDRMETYHPKFLGFEASLKQFRERATDCVLSRARFILPFPVQAHIEGRHNLGWVDNLCRIVYVDLKAHEEQYSIVQDENCFEIY